MDVKEAKYIEFIKDRFPQIRISKVQYNMNDGRYNDVVAINDEYIFKFAKFDWSAAFLDNEVKVARFACNFVDMSLPEYDYIDRGTGKCNFFKGRPLFRNELLLLDGKVQDSIAEQIGTFFRQLHSIQLKKVRNSNIGEFALDLSREAWLERYEEIERKVFPYCKSYSREYIEQIFKPLLEDESFLDFQPALIHGDLTPDHIFFDRRFNRINGITGLGIAGIGDPAYDIGVIIDNFGEAFVKRIGRYYNSISKYIDRARFYAYTSNLLWFKAVADMLTTRDFTNFCLEVKERDIMPVGSKL